jgi:hypothetical protein
MHHFVTCTFDSTGVILHKRQFGTSYWCFVFVGWAVLPEGAYWYSLANEIWRIGLRIKHSHEGTKIHKHLVGKFRRQVSTKFKGIIMLRVEVWFRPNVTPKWTHFTVMNIEMSQAKKINGAEQVVKVCFKLGWRHICITKHKTPALHTFILLQNKVSMSTHTRSWLPKINQCMFGSNECIFMMNWEKYVHRDFFYFHLYFFRLHRI